MGRPHAARSTRRPQGQTGGLEAAAVAHAGGEEGLLHDPLEVVVVGTHTLAKSFLPIYDVSYVTNRIVLQLKLRCCD